MWAEGELAPGEQDDIAPGDEPEIVDGEPVRAHIQPYRRSFDAHWKESRYASPLPSPADLERYSEMLPNAPERLLAAGEREQAHRHQIENRLVGIDEKAMPKFYSGELVGQIVAAVVALGYEGLMALAILEGYGLGGILGAAAGGIGAIIWAMRRDPRGPSAAQQEPADRDGSSQRPDGPAQDR